MQLMNADIIHFSISDFYLLADDYSSTYNVATAALILYHLQQLTVTEIKSSHICADLSSCCCGHKAQLQPSLKIQSISIGI